MTKLNLQLIPIQTIISLFYKAFTAALLYVTCIKKGIYHLDIFSLTACDDRILSSRHKAVWGCSVCESVSDSHLQGVISVYCGTVYISHRGLRYFIKLTAWCATTSLSWCYGCCEQTAKWFLTAGLLCSWCAILAALVHCLMVSATCTWGIHQNSGVKKALYSLLLTVNKELMCKADFSGRVFPHPRIATFRTEAALPHTIFWCMDWKLFLVWVDQVENITIHEEVDVCRGFPDHCLAMLRKQEQWIFNSN